MTNKHEYKPTIRTPADSDSKGTLVEKIKARLQNTKIIAYAIVIGSIIIGFSRFLEVSVRVLSAVIPANVASYDSRTEESAFQVVRAVDDFVIRLRESPEDQRTVDRFRDDFRRIEIELRQLELRNMLRPLNKHSSQMVAILSESWDRLKQHLEQEGKLNLVFVQLVHKQLRETLGMILLVEESKRNGPGDRVPRSINDSYFDKSADAEQDLEANPKDEND
jgi:hypothetical protein